MMTLREARRSRAWSIRELNKISGVATQTIVSAEAGRSIRLQSIRKMADALGLQPTEIEEFKKIIELEN